MLNWNAPWPVMNDRSDSAGPTPAANGPWDVAAIFELQTRWWNQFLDASRGFWSLYGWTPPALSLTGDSSPSAETTETIVENVIEQGTPADAEAVLESQTRLWNHFLDANRSLWAMSPWTMPTAQWLAATLALQFQFRERKHEQAAGQRQARELVHAFGDHAGWQGLLAVFERQESLATTLARHQVADAREQPEAAGAGEHQRLLGGTGDVVRGLGAAFEIDQGRDRLAVAAAAGQRADVHRIDATIARDDRQRVDAAARETAVHRVAGLEREAPRRDLVALQRAHPALQADNDRDRLVDDPDFGDGLLLGLAQGAALVAVLLGVG